MMSEQKNHCRLAGLILGSLLLSACASAPGAHRAPSPGVRAIFETSPAVVVAHRGCWREAPENSLAAIEACAQLGVDMVEIDIRETADGVLVLMHDDTLDRTTNLAGPVADYAYGELAAARLREGAGGPDAALTTQGIPTLREALLAANGEMLINLDIKETLYDEALGIIAAAGAQDRVLFKMRAAPDDPGLVGALFQGQSPYMPILVQCSDQSRDRFCADDMGDAAPLYEAFDPVAFEIVFTDDAWLFEDAAAIVAAGHPLWVNTLYPSISGGRHDDDAPTDPDAVWGSLLAQGVTIFQTDRPALLMEYLQGKGLREERRSP